MFKAEPPLLDDELPGPGSPEGNEFSVFNFFIYMYYR
jgi:hypothetical protein